MNVVRWQCNLQASRSARALNVMLFMLCGMLLLSLTWPVDWAWGRAPLLLLMLLECWRNERRLVRRQGVLALDERGHWHWCGTRWQLQRQADWLPWGVLLVLRGAQGQRWRLWLMQDNLPPQAWRTLRARRALQNDAAPR